MQTKTKLIAGAFAAACALSPLTAAAETVLRIGMTAAEIGRAHV